MKILTLSALVVTLMASTHSFAVGPGKDKMTKRNVNVGGCMASSVTASWSLDSLMGEPTVNAAYLWRGDSSCKPSSRTVLWLKVQQNRTNGGYGFVRVSPTVPRAGEESFDSTGSPDWDELACGTDGRAKGNCFSASDAKALWKDSRVVDFKFAY